MSQKTKFTKRYAGVSLSGDEAYSCSDEESGEGHVEQNSIIRALFADCQPDPNSLRLHCQPSAAAFGPAPPRAQTSAAALGPAPPCTSADGQPLAAGNLPKKSACDVKGSVGKQARNEEWLASLRAAATEEPRNKNDTGKNATRQPSRGSAQQEVHWRDRDPNEYGWACQLASCAEYNHGVPQHNPSWRTWCISCKIKADRERADNKVKNKNKNKNKSGHGQQAEHKGNWREPERRAAQIEKSVQESAKNDEENVAASDKTRPALKAQLTPARPKPSRDPHRPPSRGRRSAASSSAAASSPRPPSRGGQHSAAASPRRRPALGGGQPSAAASPGRRVDQHGKPHKARGCKGSGSSRKWAGWWPWRKRARKDKDE